MRRPRLHYDECKRMAFEDLVRAVYDAVGAYAVPNSETQDQREQRISRTLDELPDVYAFINRLHAFFDHWSDFYYSQDRSGLDYKSMRQRRDAMKDAASAAKLRYEGTSRVLTKILSEREGAVMPRGR